MEEFTLINKQRNRIKIFKPFEDISKPSPSINAMEISYGCVYKRSSKPEIKGSRIESIEDARNGRKKQFLKLFLKKLANNQLQNLLKELQTHSQPGGCQLMKSFLNKIKLHHLVLIKFSF